ncbi:Substrate binding protein (TRAP transporter) BbdB1 (plasmid) [Aminobacter sp. MSH1]|uniref:TRAP transporter substrate-binding protein DctP n=1 Tax=Aminobacter sp. MSH1 TaxID=374606 RepID=UPI0009DC66B9|nr:TRAP transporter substrate-binding protein DctP [Aminobacter sp. MSH1]ARD70007.1 Substrate binding protein (TRAP transporter) BbdB1 [Aminobacter sp. MSH1]
MTNINRCFGLAVFGLLSSSLGAYAQEVTLKAAGAFPEPFYFMTPFFDFVDEVNEEGKGLVQIQYVGGPESIPTDQQPLALRNGVIDVLYSSTAYYTGIVPEALLLQASNITPVQARESGALDDLDEVYRERLNATFLAHFGGGANFHIYLKNEPTLTEAGLPDLAGLKIRSAPNYTKFLEKLGATPVTIPPAEVNTALERGVVDGIGYPAVAFTQNGFQNYVGYRIDPGFQQLDLVLNMNVDVFNRLSDEQRDFLVEKARDWEEKVFEINSQQAASEKAEMESAGMQFFVLDDAASTEYLDIASSTILESVKERAPDLADELFSKLTTAD